jgi:hypothetical protein
VQKPKTLVIQDIMERECLSFQFCVGKTALVEVTPAKAGGNVVVFVFFITAC